jgi:hypothetical protein
MPTVDPPEERAAARFEVLVWIRHAFLGLLMGFVSMMFAWGGAMIGRYLVGVSIIAP